MSRIVHTLYNQTLSLSHYFKAFMTMNTAFSVLFPSHCKAQQTGTKLSCSLMTCSFTCPAVDTAKTLVKCIKYYLFFTSSLQVCLWFSESLRNFWHRYSSPQWIASIVPCLLYQKDIIKNLFPQVQPIAAVNKTCSEHKPLVKRPSTSVIKKKK